MSKLRWILCALGLWIVFVIVQTPASWAAYFMTKSGDLALTGVSGSFWQGSASIASIKVQGKNYSLGSLRWHLQPLSLIALSPCAEIITDFERQQVTGTLCSSFSGAIKLSDATINIPASILQDFAPETKLDGQVSAHINTLAFKENRFQALSGNVSWTQARVLNNGTWLEVGSFAADLAPTTEGQPSADVFTLEGPVDLKSKITLPLAGGIFIQGDVAMTPEFSRTVQAEQWLPMVAEPLDNGRYRLDLSL